MFMPSSEHINVSFTLCQLKLQTKTQQSFLGHTPLRISKQDIPGLFGKVRALCTLDLFLASTGRLRFCLNAFSNEGIKFPLAARTLLKVYKSHSVLKIRNFILEYWFNQRILGYNTGQFIRTTFNIKKCVVIKLLVSISVSTVWKLFDILMIHPKCHNTLSDYSCFMKNNSKGILNLGHYHNEKLIHIVSRLSIRLFFEMSDKLNSE
ncbi:hypothetical protein BC833DRAFT_561920 [Globomyces pollinis-pini]|nr:hypothetical protein BC833DRAFT_561920 [Globomyces pollinis-pini]